MYEARQNIENRHSEVVGYSKGGVILSQENDQRLGEFNQFKIVDVGTFWTGLGIFALGIFVAWRLFLKNLRSLFFPTFDLFDERPFQEETDNHHHADKE